MKTILVALTLFAISACGAITPDEPVEKKTGAVIYGTSSYSLYHIASNFHCTTPFIAGSNFQFGVAMQVHPLVPAWSGQYASATYGVEFFDNHNETLSMYMTTLPMVETMDGPYHVLVNPWITGVGMWLSPNTTGVPVTPSGWLKYPSEIPPYGLWIYAAGEQAAYPNGAVVLTLDPSFNPINPTSNPSQGRCGSRRQWVFAL